MRPLAVIRIAAVSATLLSMASHRLAAQPLTITHLAGVDGGSGRFDGRGAAARFAGPHGLAADGIGNVYVADGDTIRRIVVATGEVSTLAGLAGSPGSADGTGSTARFNGASDIAFDGAGKLFVADSLNYTIRQVVLAVQRDAGQSLEPVAQRPDQAHLLFMDR